MDNLPKSATIGQSRTLGFAPCYLVYQPLPVAHPSFLLSATSPIANFLAPVLDYTGLRISASLYYYGSLLSSFYSQISAILILSSPIFLSHLSI